MFIMHEYLSALNKLNINERQFTTLYGIYLITQGDKRHVEGIKKFINLQGVIKNGRKVLLSDEDKNDLISKELIVEGITDDGKPELKLCAKFLNSIVDTTLLFDDMFRTYPSFAMINDVKIPLKSCNRFELANDYIRAIKGSVTENAEVIKDIEYGKLKGGIVLNIKNFVAARFWESLREERTQISSFATNSVTSINDKDL